MSNNNARTELAMRAHVARIQKMKDINTPGSGTKYSYNNQHTNNSTSTVNNGTSSLNSTATSDVIQRDRENMKDGDENSVPSFSGFSPSTVPSSILPISLSPTHTLNSVASQAEAELHRLRNMIAASQNQRAKLVAAAVAEVEAIKENSLQSGASNSSTAPSSSSPASPPNNNNNTSNNTNPPLHTKHTPSTTTPSKVTSPLTSGNNNVLSPVSSTIQSLITGITIPTFSPPSTSSPSSGNHNHEQESGQFSPMRVNPSQNFHPPNKSTPPSAMRPFPVDLPPPPPGHAPILSNHLPPTSSSHRNNVAHNHQPPFTSPNSTRRLAAQNLDLIENSDDNQVITLTKRELRIKLSEAVATAAEEAFEAAREQNSDNIREMLQSAESEKTFAISDAETKAQMAIAAIQERMAGLEAVRQARAQARERDLRTLINQAEEKAVAKEKALRGTIDTANERAREAVANSRKAEKEVTQLREEMASSEAYRQSLVTENTTLKQQITDLQKQMVSLQHSSKPNLDNDEKNRVNEMIQFYENQTQDLRNKLHEVTQIRASAETRMKEMESHQNNQLRDLKAEIEINRNTIQVLKEELEDAHAQQRRLESLLDERDATISQLELQIANNVVTSHHSDHAHSGANSSGRVGYLSPPEVQTLKDNHARELAVAADKAEAEKRRAVLEATHQAEAKAAAEKNNIMAAARDAALADSERARMDAVRNALAEASNGFKQQLSNALSTLRTQLDKERQAEIEAKVSEARTEYEGIVAGWETQNENWRKETMAACERSLEMARQQVTEARTAANRSEVKVLNLSSEIAKYREALISFGQDPDTIVQVSSPRTNKSKHTPTTNRSNRSHHSPYVTSPPPQYPSMNDSMNDTVSETNDKPSSVDGGLGPLDPESMTEEDFIRLNEEMHNNNNAASTSNVPRSHGMAPPQPPMDNNDTNSLDGNSVDDTNDSSFYDQGLNNNNNNNNDSRPSSTTSSINFESAPPCPPGVPQRLYETILTLPVNSLRNLLDKAGITNRDCVEKTELQDRLLKAVEKGQGISTSMGNSSINENDNNNNNQSYTEESSRSSSVTSSINQSESYNDEQSSNHNHKPSSSHPMKKVPSPAELKNWLPAQAEDGSIYYYHRVTRAVRWDRPDADLARRMEERIRDEAAAVKTRQQDRLAAMAAEEEAKAAEAVVRNKLESEIDHRVKTWSKNKSIRNMLATLSTVLHYIKRPLPEDIATTAATGSNEDIKKAYLRAVRVVHPDKMSGGPLEAQVEAQRVFAALSEAYTRFTNGDESTFTSAYSGQTHHRNTANTRHGVPPPGIPTNPYGNRMYPGVNTSNAMAAAAARARAAMAHMNASRSNIPPGFPTATNSNNTSTSSASSSSARYTYANNAPYGFGRPGK